MDSQEESSIFSSWEVKEVLSFPFFQSMSYPLPLLPGFGEVTFLPSPIAVILCTFRVAFRLPLIVSLRGFFFRKVVPVLAPLDPLRE